jgi:hypothetical protein
MGLPTITVPQYSLTLPSTEKEYKYRPFLVKEEKILLIAMESEDESQIMNATINIIKNCIVGDINIDDLPMFDIEYIFLQLRGKSKGEILELKYTCPKCNGQIPVGINIDDIKVNKKDGHSKKIELNDTLGIVMKYPNINIQKKLASIVKDSSEIEGLFETIIHCIDYIYDAESTYPAKDHTQKELTDFLESLNDSQFQKVSKFFETAPSLKHEVKLECKGKIKGDDKKKSKTCGYKEDLVLEGLASFFD